MEVGRASSDVRAAFVLALDNRHAGPARFAIVALYLRMIGLVLH